jgi:iron complex transport system ATP-binding protein
MAILEVKQIDASYRKRQVLFGIDFAVEPGRIFGLLGPNGSGKTTLLKIICRVMRPSRGEVALDGNPVRSLSNNQLSRIIAVVPQVTHVEFNFTAQQMAAMGRNPYQTGLGLDSAEDERIVRESMEATETWELRGRMFKELSGGESQRVLLARCLAQRCKLLLLDEPTAHLDIKYQSEIFRLLRRLRSEHNITILVSTHDLNLAAAFCDEVLLIRDGGNFALGTPGAVINEENVRKVLDAGVRVTTDPHLGKPFVSPEY